MYVDVDQPRIEDADGDLPGQHHVRHELRNRRTRRDCPWHGTTITSDTPDPSTVGQPYTVNVSVARLTGTLAITGTVTVYGRPDGCSDTTATGGTAATVTYSCSIRPQAGSKTLTAWYAGNSIYGPSSGTAAHTVTKANTTTTLASDLPDPSVVGELVIISYSVAIVAPGAGAPSGTVTITDADSAQSCTGSPSAGSCTIAFAATGTHHLTATYGGDANFNGSASTPAVLHTVNKAATTTSITSIFLSTAVN